MIFFPRNKERRAARRFEMKTPFRYRPADGEPNADWKSGRTLDMSARGILLAPIEGIATGSRLDLVMDWPGIYHGKDMVRLFVTGAVVRVDERGVALHILSHKFRDLRPAVENSLRQQRSRAVA